MFVCVSVKTQTENVRCMLTILQKVHFRKSTKLSVTKNAKSEKEISEALPWLYFWAVFEHVLLENVLHRCASRVLVLWGLSGKMSSGQRNRRRGNGSSFLLCFFPFLVFLDVPIAPEFTLATVVAKVLNLRLSHHQWNRVNRGPVVHLVHLGHH